MRVYFVGDVIWPPSFFFLKLENLIYFSLCIFHYCIGNVVVVVLLVIVGAS